MIDSWEVNNTHRSTICYLNGMLRIISNILEATDNEKEKEVLKDKMNLLESTVSFLEDIDR